MRTHLKRTFAVVSISALFLTSLHADERGTLIFSDDFERNESQETKDEVGNGWGTNSNSRAAGHKQVDLKNGAMHIFIHEAADHAVSVRHDAEFTNGFVELRFLLENPKDTLGLDFADMQLKSVHAGHLFKVTVGNNKLDIMDSKTGSMNLTIYDAKKADKLTPEMKKTLAATKKVFPTKLETGQWHALAIRIAGDTVSVAIDGKDAGSFRSAGFAHPTKRMLRLSVPKQAVVDDVKILSSGT
jgi:hypothetical protein